MIQIWIWGKLWSCVQKQHQQLSRIGKQNHNNDKLPRFYGVCFIFWIFMCKELNLGEIVRWFKSWTQHPYMPDSYRDWLVWFYLTACTVCTASFCFFHRDKFSSPQSAEQHCIKTALLQQQSPRWTNHSFDILHDASFIYLFIMLYHLCLLSVFVLEMFMRGWMTDPLQSKSAYRYKQKNNPNLNLLKGGMKNGKINNFGEMKHDDRCCEREGCQMGKSTSILKHTHTNKTYKSQIWKLNTYPANKYLDSQRHPL